MWTRQKSGLFLLLTVLLLWIGTGCKPPGVRAMFEGEALLKDGKPKEAVPQFELAVENLPNEWRAWNYLGLARHRAGDLTGARKAYDQAVKLAGSRRLAQGHPSLVLYFNTGRLHLDLGRVQDARNDLETFAHGRPEDYNAAFWLAEAHRAAKEPALAAAQYQRTVNLKPDFALAWNRLGVAQIQLKRPADAAQSFQNALKQRDDFAEAQLNLALTYHRHAPDGMENREALALEAFQTYLSMEPADANQVQPMVDDLRQRLNPVASIPLPTGNGTNTVAQPALTNTVAGLPEPPLRGLTDSNFVVEVRFPPGGTNGRPATVIRQRPFEPQPPALTTTNTAAIPRGTNTVAGVPGTTRVDIPPPPAVSTNSVAGTVRPENPEPVKPEPVKPEPLVVELPVEVPEVPGIARYTATQPARPERGNQVEAKRFFDAALHQHKLNKFDHAIAGYREAIRQDPGYPHAHMNLAMALESKGEHTEALPLYELALAESPTSQPARLGFARSLRAGKFYVDAAIQLEQLVGRHRNNAAAHFELAAVYANHLNLPDRAVKHYQRLLELNPNHPDAGGIRRWIFNRTQR